MRAALLSLALVACGGHLADDASQSDAASAVDASVDHTDAGTLDATILDATVSDATPIDAANWPQNNGFEECSLFVDGQNVIAVVSALAYLSSAQPPTLAFGCHGFVNDKTFTYTFFGGVRLDTNAPQWAEVDVGPAAHVASAKDLASCSFDATGPFVVDAGVFVKFTCASVDGIAVDGKLTTPLSPGP